MELSGDRFEITLKENKELNPEEVDTPNDTEVNPTLVEEVIGREAVASVLENEDDANSSELLATGGLTTVKEADDEAEANCKELKGSVPLDASVMEEPSEFGAKNTAEV